MWYQGPAGHSGGGSVGSTAPGPSRGAPLVWRPQKRLPSQPGIWSRALWKECLDTSHKKTEPQTEAAWAPGRD